MCSICQAVWQSVDLCAVTRLFLSLGKHPGSGYTQMVGNNGMELNRVFSWGEETLKVPHQCFPMFKCIYHKPCMHYPWQYLSVCHSSSFRIFLSTICFCPFYILTTLRGSKPTAFSSPTRASERNTTFMYVFKSSHTETSILHWNQFFCLHYAHSLDIYPLCYVSGRVTWKNSIMILTTMLWL